MSEIRIGMIGLDTSHVTAFTSLLHDKNHEHHVPGGRVLVAYPGGSKDFDMSINRLEKFTGELRDKHGVRIVESPEAVAEACDLLFIESVDGRVHLEQFRRTVKFGKPTFIDKPFTVNLKEAEEIDRLAREAGVTVMSSSSLRYAERLAGELEKGKGDIVGCDVFGPMAEQPTQPGLFWYGIHAVEMLVAALGVGCREVRAFRNDGNDLVMLIWGDGRVASLRGLRGVHKKFGMTLHRKEGYAYLDLEAGRAPYAGLLAAILRTLPHGKSDVPMAETMEVIRIIEAANQARETGRVAELKQ